MHAACNLRCLYRLHYQPNRRAEIHSSSFSTAHLSHLTTGSQRFPCIGTCAATYYLAALWQAEVQEPPYELEAPWRWRRFVYLCKAAARLEMALCNYAFQKVISKGYMPVCTPDLVRASVLQRCGFQPRAENTQVRQRALSQAGLAPAGWAELAGSNGAPAWTDALLASLSSGHMLSLSLDKTGCQTSISSCAC